MFSILEARVTKSIACNILEYVKIKATEGVLSKIGHLQNQGYQLIVLICAETGEQRKSTYDYLIENKIHYIKVIYWCENEVCSKHGGFFETYSERDIHFKDYQINHNKCLKSPHRWNQNSNTYMRCPSVYKNVPVRRIVICSPEFDYLNETNLRAELHSRHATNVEKYKYQ